MALFHQLDKSSQMIQNKLGYSYLEALIESMENIIGKGDLPEEYHTLDQESVQILQNIYAKIPNDLEPETIRRGVQLAILKAIKEDAIQPNYQMTPDSIGFLVAYFIEIFAQVKGRIHLADLAAGSGNLLYTIHHYLTMKDISVDLTGVDNDELMLSLAATSGAFQKTKCHLLLQDALRPIYMKPAHIIVSDLPIGYYPDDENASNYQTSFAKGHSYSHYLLMEQQLSYLVDEGFAFYIVPTFVLNDDTTSSLLSALQQNSYIQGIIELPYNLFLNERSRKSILILQKHGKHARQLETLVTQIPEFKEIQQMEEFLSQMKNWKENNK